MLSQQSPIQFQGQMNSLPDNYSFQSFNAHSQIRNSSYQSATLPLSTSSSGQHGMMYASSIFFSEAKQPQNDSVPYGGHHEIFHSNFPHQSYKFAETHTKDSMLEHGDTTASGYQNHEQMDDNDDGSSVFRKSYKRRDAETLRSTTMIKELFPEVFNNKESEIKENGIDMKNKEQELVLDQRTAGFNDEIGQKYMSLKSSLFEQQGTSKGETKTEWKVMDNRNNLNMNYTAEVTAAAMTATVLPQQSQIQNDTFQQIDGRYSNSGNAVIFQNYSGIDYQPYTGVKALTGQAFQQSIYPAAGESSLIKQDTQLNNNNNISMLLPVIQAINKSSETSQQQGQQVNSIPRVINYDSIYQSTQYESANRQLGESQKQQQQYQILTQPQQRDSNSISTQLSSINNYQYNSNQGQVAQYDENKGKYQDLDILKSSYNNKPIISNSNNNFTSNNYQIVQDKQNIEESMVNQTNQMIIEGNSLQNVGIQLTPNYMINYSNNNDNHKQSDMHSQDQKIPIASVYQNTYLGVDQQIIQDLKQHSTPPAERKVVEIENVTAVITEQHLETLKQKPEKERINDKNTILGDQQEEQEQDKSRLLERQQQQEDGNQETIGIVEKNCKKQLDSSPCKDTKIDQIKGNLSIDDVAVDSRAVNDKEFIDNTLQHQEISKDIIIADNNLRNTEDKIKSSKQTKSDVISNIKGQQRSQQDNISKKKNKDSTKNTKESLDAFSAIQMHLQKTIKHFDSKANKTYRSPSARPLKNQSSPLKGQQTQSNTEEQLKQVEGCVIQDDQKEANMFSTCQRLFNHFKERQHRKDYNNPYGNELHVSSNLHNIHGNSENSRYQLNQECNTEQRFRLSQSVKSPTFRHSVPSKQTQSLSNSSFRTLGKLKLNDFSIQQTNLSKDTLSANIKNSNSISKDRNKTIDWNYNHFSNLNHYRSTQSPQIKENQSTINRSCWMTQSYNSLRQSDNNTCGSPQVHTEPSQHQNIYSSVGQSPSQSKPRGTMKQSSKKRDQLASQLCQKSIHGFRNGINNVDSENNNHITIPRHHTTTTDISINLSRNSIVKIHEHNNNNIKDNNNNKNNYKNTSSSLKLLNSLKKSKYLLDQDNQSKRNSIKSLVVNIDKTTSQRRLTTQETNDSRGGKASPIAEGSHRNLHKKTTMVKQINSGEKNRVEINISPKCQAREPRQSVQQRRTQKISKESQSPGEQKQQQIFNETIDLYQKKCHDLSIQIGKQNSSKIGAQKENAHKSLSKERQQQHETSMFIQNQAMQLQQQQLSKSSVSLSNQLGQSKNVQLSQVLEQNQEIHAYKLEQQVQLLEIEQLIQQEKQSGEINHEKGYSVQQQCNNEHEKQANPVSQSINSEKINEGKPKESQQRAIKDSNISSLLLNLVQNTGKNHKNIKKDIKTDSNVDNKIREEKQKGKLECKINVMDTKGIGNCAEESSIQELTRDLKKYLAEQNLQNRLEANRDSEKLECSERVVQPEEDKRISEKLGSFMDRNQKWLEEKQRKRQQQQDHTNFKQMKECTFTPLTNSSKKLVTQGDNKQEKQSNMPQQRNKQPVHLQNNQQGETKISKQINKNQKNNPNWNSLKSSNKEQHIAQMEGKATPFGLTPLPSPIYKQFAGQTLSQTTSVHERKFSRESQDENTSELKKDIEDVLGILQNFL